MKELDHQVARVVRCHVNGIAFDGQDQFREPAVGMLVHELGDLCPGDIVCGVGASPFLFYVRKSDDSRQVGEDGSGV